MTVAQRGGGVSAGRIIGSLARLAYNNRQSIGRVGRAAYDYATGGSSAPSNMTSGRGRLNMKRVKRPQQNLRRSAQSQASGQVSKYHDIKNTYKSKKWGKKSKKKYNFRKRVIKAVLDDAPAKQFVMNTYGVNAFGSTAVIPVVSGSQQMLVVGSLYSWCGNVGNAGGYRDCYDMHSNLVQVDGQAYTSSLGTSKVYSNIFDSKTRIEGGYSEIMINNPSGGNTMTLDLYECVCRRDIFGQNDWSDLLTSNEFAETRMNDVFAPQGQPAAITSHETFGVTPFQIDGFVHSWKIVKCTRVRLEANASTTYTMSKRSYKTIHGEYFRGLTEGEDDVFGHQVAKKGLTRILVCRAYGDPTSTGTGAASLYFNNIRRYTGRLVNSKPEELALLRQP